MKLLKRFLINMRADCKTPAWLKSKILAAIAMLWIASPISASEISPEVFAERLHVCTVANWRHPNLAKLIASCEQVGIELEILGMSEPYRRNTDKLVAMKKYCAQLPDDDLVLFVDAFDVLILADRLAVFSARCPNAHVGRDELLAIS